MKRIILSYLAFGVLISGHSQNRIASWDFSNTTAYGDSLKAADTILSAFVQSAVLIRGAGVKTNNNAAGGGWGGIEFTEHNLTDAVSSGDFITIEITPKTGKIIAYTRIAPYNIRHSATGPDTGQWQYSVDGGLIFENIGSPIAWGNNTSTAAGNDQDAIDLSGIAALQAVSEKVIFRLVNWGGTGATGSWYFNSTSTVPSANKQLAIQTSQPLPVDLKAFYAVKRLTHVELNWITAKEKENTGFEIERRNATNQWKSLGFVGSRTGTAKQPLNFNYQFCDFKPEEGKNFYRLKQINWNGSFTYSEIELVDFNTKVPAVAIYPNPAQHELKIVGLKGNGIIELFGLSGRLLRHWELQNIETGISLSDLDAGNYFIKVHHTETAAEYAFQLIKGN